MAFIKINSKELFVDSVTGDEYEQNPDGTLTKCSTNGAMHTANFDGVVASDGALLPIDSLAQTLAYNADGTLDYVEVTHNAVTYRQTMSYIDGELTGVSAWVAQ